MAEFIGVPSMNLIRGTLTENGGKTVLKSGELELELDPSRLPKNPPAREILLGLRPQHIHSSGGEVLYKNRIQAVENLGRDCLVTTQVGETRLSCYVQPSQNLKVNEAMPLDFKMDQAQFFDPESGKSLLW